MHDLLNQGLELNYKESEWVLYLASTFPLFPLAAQYTVSVHVESEQDSRAVHGHTENLPVVEIEV